VFLTGATGYTGGLTLKYLVEAGHSVVALARRPPNGDTDGADGVRWVTGDFSDRAVITACLAGVDGALHIGASHDAEMERLDKIVITAIGDAFAGSGRVFITTSATPVYGPTGPTPRDEHEPIENPHPLRAWRMRHDLEVAGLESRGVRGVVIRPGYIFGRAGGVLADVIRRAQKSGEATYVGDGETLSSTVHIDALSELYLLALANPIARGIYNAVSDEVIRSADIAKTVAAAFGPGITAKSWPIEDARRSLGELADLTNMTCVAHSLRARRELGWVASSRSLLGELVGGSYQTGPLQPYKA
jgi:nucleoside-diphosphate-sugar epimerase